jgi:hypothetical protein
MNWAKKMLAFLEEETASAAAPKPAVPAPVDSKVPAAPAAARPRTVEEAVFVARSQYATAGRDVGKVPLPCGGCIEESAKAMRKGR